MDWKKTLKERRCPRCGGKLIPQKVTRSTPGKMHCCENAINGSGCTFFVRGFIKHSITNKKRK